MRKTLLTTIAMITLAFSTLARAQGAPPLPTPPPAPPVERGYHTHDGFFLQMDLGFGSMKSKSDTFTDPFLGAGQLEFSGAAGQFGIANGGAVMPNFIVAGHLWGATVSSPDVKFAGNTGSTTDTTQTLSGIGVNLTYYLMPYNVYLSATPSIGGLTVEQGNTKFETDSGFAIRLAVGKEWWVSTNWGLGLNLQYAHGSNQDKDGVTTFGTNWFGAAFSATYN
jgi:hypothetical protein